MRALLALLLTITACDFDSEPAPPDASTICGIGTPFTCDAGPADAGIDASTICGIGTPFTCDAGCSDIPGSTQPCDGGAQ